jgi:predicted outer membrane repeat protein
MRWLLALCTLCALAMPSGAATYLVRPDGSGDFPTIQAAIDAAADGDVVGLADGTFRGPGNRDIDYHGKAITIRSQAGDPDWCIIDCEGTYEDQHRGFDFHSGEGPGASLQGVTVIGGYVRLPAPDGGGVRCSSASPTFFDCVFADNYADSDGGGLYAAGGSPVFVRCVFAGNSTLGYGGGAFLAGGPATVIDCSFRNNRSEYSHGGGVACYNSHASISRCAFVENWAQNAGGLECEGGAVSVNESSFLGNTAASHGGAVQCRAGAPAISTCTFVGNSASTGGAVDCFYYAQVAINGCTFYANVAFYEATAVKVADYAHLSMENTVAAFGVNGIGVRCTAPGTATLLCCDIYGNEEGDWVENIAGQLGVDGNICADPLFCDPGAGELGLGSDSPCAPENSPDCGQIGAWPVACGPTSTTQTSWGALKALFRP